MTKIRLEEFEKYVLKHPRVALGLSAVTLGYVGLRTLRFLKNSIVALTRKGYNLIERYGAGSWAVVTGASDGIGRQFSLTLAQQGFNIVLIARNKAKLEAVESEIKAQSPGVSTRIIIADFEQSAELGFFERIVEQLDDLDVSLLVNNAGVGIYTRFEKATQANLRSMLNINVYPTVLLTNLLIPKMLKRANRSGIINVGSGLGTVPVPYASTYSGTKALVNFFTQAIAFEFRDRIDILAHLCGRVSTKWNNFAPTSFSMLTPKEAVEGILRELGSETNSGGNWKHQFLLNFLPFAPIHKQILKVIEAQQRNHQ
eukprot:TRINITY_DN3385_c0_g5_i1.p1 TRINITY_DN3385_c0_g5~~TRINITY_DN3385_c0_g5_i1.p1  ORF type:complete len:314 (+),score=49.87 TRINITY_DN3385_c0_g5_i1:40-981(+)